MEEALKDHKKVRLYYEIGADFKGIDPGAIWKDFKVGMEHMTRWERIAVVTDINWIRHTIQIFSFIIPGEIAIFPLSEVTKARKRKNICICNSLIYFARLRPECIK